MKKSELKRKVEIKNLLKSADRDAWLRWIDEDGEKIPLKEYERLLKLRKCTLR